MHVATEATIGTGEGAEGSLHPSKSMLVREPLQWHLRQISSSALDTASSTNVRIELSWRDVTRRGECDMT